MRGEGGNAVAEFVARWKGRDLTERQAAHSHFIDLCDLLGVEKPLYDRTKDHEYLFDAVTASPGSKAYTAAMKATGEPSSARSKQRAPSPSEQREGEALFAGPGAVVHVSAVDASHGWVDVWKKDCFCWEYKRSGRSHKTLSAALAQLKTYKDSLDNPPLMVVCDIDHYEIHTNFTGHPAQVYRFTIDDLEVVPEQWKAMERGGVSPLQALRYVFTNPEWFRPGQTVEDVTREIAEDFGTLALNVMDYKGEDKKAKYEPYAVAHFLMQMIFAMFAEDIDLLPADTVRDICNKWTNKPDVWVKVVRDLLEAMAEGGTFGDEVIAHFNGGLFKDVAKQVIPRLLPTHIGKLQQIAAKNWAAIEPSIIGTLFERSLDPKKRSQIGAHYTSRADIMLLIEPVIMEPLRAEWRAVQAKVGELLKKKEGARSDKAREEAHAGIASAMEGFAARLGGVRVLDPACGSGNFLYVALQCLLDLEKEVVAFGARPEIGVGIRPRVSPLQLHGIEINEYAAELARVSVWIGYLKWKRENGVTKQRRPILDKLDTIENRDAILDHLKVKGKSTPVPARWPDADFIVGNPPFLGSKLMRKHGLSNGYLDELFSLYEIPNSSDLVCYWFERARQEIERRKELRVGLIATQGIRGGDNRTVLKRIKESGDIFMAWSDREWTLDGAAVQVSMVGFGERAAGSPTLDGRCVKTINADLSSSADATSARELTTNESLAFMGDTKGGAFDVTLGEAIGFLSQNNPHKRPNSEVVVPWVNGLDVTRRPRAMWVIDFGIDLDEEQAARYQAPFRYVERLVKPERAQNRREAYAAKWWIHVEPRPAMRKRLLGRPRFLVTPTLTKFRLFRWEASPTLPDHQLITFARDDDYFFGVLHSAVHEVWALRQGTQLEDRPRYTPTSCFETFPLPWAPGKEPTEPKQRHHGLWKAIGEAARELDGLREEWLNPADKVAWHRQLAERRYADELKGLEPAVREQVVRSAVAAAFAEDKALSRLTLTNLYNERPAWLRLAHKKLDRAVLAAYAAVDPEGGWDVSWADVFEPYGAGEIPDEELKLKKNADVDAEKAAFAERKGARDAARGAREPVVERVLGNLLRMNLARAGVKGQRQEKEEDE